MKLSVVSSTGGSYCWNYGTNTFYTGMLVDLSVAIMHVTVSAAIRKLEVSAALMLVTFSAANMWVTICILIMQKGVSVSIMQVVFSAVDYAHDCFCCNYSGDSIFIAM